MGHGCSKTSTISSSDALHLASLAVAQQKAPKEVTLTYSMEDVSANGNTLCFFGAGNVMTTRRDEVKVFAFDIPHRTIIVLLRDNTTIKMPVDTARVQQVNTKIMQLAL